MRNPLIIKKETAESVVSIFEAMTDTDEHRYFWTGIWGFVVVTGIYMIFMINMAPKNIKED